jgi:hypothetical protein
MKHVLGVLVALLAILTWTFAGTIVELESYRSANAGGLCHVAAVDYAADAGARQAREQCLAAAKTSTGAIGHLLHALHIQ